MTALDEGIALLREWLDTEAVDERVVTYWREALTAVAAEPELRTPEGRLHLMYLFASVHFIGLQSREVVHDALYALLVWGTRRAAQNRRVPWSEADVRAMIAAARAELAELRQTG
jgi:hypothetical protein